MTNTLEILGYAAMGVVLLSFTMKVFNKLRALNLIGCSMFIVYGIGIQSVPVILTNALIASINTWHLLRKSK